METSFLLVPSIFLVPPYLLQLLFLILMDTNKMNSKNLPKQTKKFRQNKPHENTS